jgi:two-component system response regulator ChvI
MPEIAIVDDEPNILISLRLNFRQWGYSVRTYSDPCAALPELIAQPPDVLILNGRMPGMHGLELYRRLRASSDVPVIFLSAHAERIADELVRCGTPAQAYVDKPFWQEVLLHLVEDVLGEGRLPQGSVHTILDAAESGG